jgi:hypothetical protein
VRVGGDRLQQHSGHWGLLEPDRGLGRTQPDLVDLGGQLHRLAELSDGVEVFPGHVAGSLCGAAMSSKASSTIGFERRYNHALRIETEEEFVDESAAGAAQLRPRTWTGSSR